MTLEMILVESIISWIDDYFFSEIVDLIINSTSWIYIHDSIKKCHLSSNPIF